MFDFRSQVEGGVFKRLDLFLATFYGFLRCFQSPCGASAFLLKLGFVCICIVAALDFWVLCLCVAFVAFGLKRVSLCKGLECFDSNAPG